MCAHARNCLRQPRGANLWNLLGFPNLERETQRLCDACVVTNVSTASYNCSAKRETSTLVRAHARNSLWQPRGTIVEPLGVPKFGTRES